VQWVVEVVPVRDLEPQGALGGGNTKKAGQSRACASRICCRFLSLERAHPQAGVGLVAGAPVCCVVSGSAQSSPSSRRSQSNEADDAKAPLAARWTRPAVKGCLAVLIRYTHRFRLPDSDGFADLRQALAPAAVSKKAIVGTTHKPFG
jgi:hypothetical protein